jgi:catechol 2,3-dioxygenase-like lactoylglutathione lyase family enzyme
MMQSDYGAAVFVSDLDRALAFYEKLGFKLEGRGGEPGVSWVEITLPDGYDWIALVEFEEPKQHKDRIGGHTGLVFVTDKIHRAYEDLKKKGVRFQWKPESRPWGGLDAQFMDQDGNKILLVDQTKELTILRSHRPTPP